MKYRKFGKLGWEASALGFGTMRLPYLDGARSECEHEQPLAGFRLPYKSLVNVVRGSSLH